jgi:hypothetical protein
LNYGTAKEKNSFVFMGSLTTNIYNNPVFCSWHVDRAWQVNLSKIIDKKRSNVYKTLKLLQQDVDVDKFVVSLDNFIKQLI